MATDNFKGKLAVVTGASSGIGACIVKDLLDAEMTVIGLARRIERLDALRQSLTKEQQSRFRAYKCNVAKADEVADVFMQVTGHHGPIAVLVNNAGSLLSGQLCKMPAEQMEQVLQTNVMGVVNCTRHAFASMQAHNKEGNVILINSILGHHVAAIPGHLPVLNIYPATKYALTAINEIYRQEFRELGTRIKVTSISPGLVDTPLIKEETKQACGIKILQPEDVSRAVMFVLSSPPHVNIYEMIIKPAGDLI